MFEIILTEVAVQTENGAAYPATLVRRIEFDTQDAMLTAVHALMTANGVTNAETLHA